MTKTLTKPRTARKSKSAPTVTELAAESRQRAQADYVRLLHKAADNPDRIALTAIAKAGRMIGHDAETVQEHLGKLRKLQADGERFADADTETRRLWDEATGAKRAFDDSVRVMKQRERECGAARVAHQELCRQHAKYRQARTEYSWMFENQE